MSTTIGTVASVHRFPVKSMQGDAPDAVELTEGGIAGDRTWALRDTETGKLVSAKRPRLWRALLDMHATGTGDDVLVTLPDGDQLSILDPGLPVALEAVLGRSVAVERFEAPMQGNYESDWPEIEGLTLSGEVEIPMNLAGVGTGFIDVGVLHTLTSTSMSTLAERNPELVVDVARFRPSIVFDTPELQGFPENDWDGRTLRIGDGVVLAAEGPAPRCVMTTVAQGELPAQPGVLQTLATENRITSDMGTYACLGGYASVTEGGTVRVGDSVVLD